MGGRNKHHVLLVTKDRVFVINITAITSSSVGVCISSSGINAFSFFQNQPIDIHD